MARPRMVQDTTYTSVPLPLRTVERLRQEAAAQGITRSELIRRALCTPEEYPTVQRSA